MSEVPPKVAKTFQKMKEEMDGYVQLVYTNGSYCVRKGTSVWDKDKKKTKKIMEHIGVIALDGTFKRKIPRKKFRRTKREVFEFGTSALAHHYLKDVEKILGELTSYVDEIIACSIIKSIDSKPLKTLSSRWSKFYLSKEINVSLSANHISDMLRNIGSNMSLWHELFSKLIDKNDIMLYDLSKIFTYSKNINIAEKAWNPKHKLLDQLGIFMAFSLKNQKPIGLDVFPGSMKETKVIRDYRQRYPNNDVCCIMDRGFTDYKLLIEFREDKIHYIIPLKKDSKYMDLRWVRMNVPFEYRKRYIQWGKKKFEHGFVYFFDDPKVRGEQEATLFKHLAKGKITKEKFEEKRKVSGIIGIISDLNKEPIEIYDLYKGREDVEIAFDALNNHIDSDKTYLSDYESIRGYYFISFIALRVYFNILKRLRERELTKKISVDDVLLELSKVMIIKKGNQKGYLAKIPKETEKIIDIFPEVFDNL